MKGEGGKGGDGSQRGVYVAYLFVHCLAILSCSVLLVRYCVAMLPTRGSAERYKDRKKDRICKELAGQESL